jgi:hypothetical protein
MGQTVFFDSELQKMGKIIVEREKFEELYKNSDSIVSVQQEEIKLLQEVSSTKDLQLRNREEQIWALEEETGRLGKEVKRTKIKSGLIGGLAGALLASLVALLF